MLLSAGASQTLAAGRHSLSPSSSGEEAPGARRASSVPFPPQGHGDAPRGAHPASGAVGRAAGSSPDPGLGPGAEQEVGGGGEGWLRPPGAAGAPPSLLANET